MEIYVVKNGDTAEDIARQFKIPLFLLRAVNNLDMISGLVSGMALLIVKPTRYHTVKANETLFSIAGEYGKTENEIYRNNPQLAAQPVLYPGQTIVVEYEDVPVKKIKTNGYAYPYINQQILDNSLPYMSCFTPFTYGIREDGRLILLDDEKLIQRAYNYGSLPFMHLSTLTEDGGFSNQLADRVLRDMTVQNTLIDDILKTVSQKDYRGLDVDFEFVYPEDSLLYGDFLGRLREILGKEGLYVVSALAPKTSDDQKGLLYEGHNYQKIGDNTDGVLLMTYEWGYTYGPEMAVAPIRSVENVVDYALEKIPPEKILLGIPNYGYDFALPYVKGESKARSISNVEALEIAIRNGAEVSFDEYSASPYFSYKDQTGKEHEVWFEDVRSIKQKLDLIARKNLAGAGYWNLMRPFQQNWSLLNAMFTL